MWSPDFPQPGLRPAAAARPAPVTRLSSLVPNAGKVRSASGSPHLDMHSSRRTVEGAEERPPQHQHEHGVACRAKCIPGQRRRRVEGQEVPQRVPRTEAGKPSGPPPPPPPPAEPKGREGAGKETAEHPTATIWNGGQGPSPPANNPDANVPTAPSTKPKAGPNELPATSTTMNIAENPATKPGSLSATIAAPSTPTSATVLGPMPPRPSSTNSRKPSAARRTTMMPGAS